MNLRCFSFGFKLRLYAEEGEEEGFGLLILAAADDEEMVERCVINPL